LRHATERFIADGLKVLSQEIIPKSPMSASLGVRASTRAFKQAYPTSFRPRFFLANVLHSPSGTDAIGNSLFRHGRVAFQTRFLHLRRALRPKALQIRFQPSRSRTYASTKPSTHTPPTQLNSPEASQSFSQRLKQLSKEYGWTAVGVYLGLSALDFPFCFLAVRLLGTERIGRWEHAIVASFWSIVSIPFPTLRPQPEPAGVESGDAAELEAAKREGPPSSTAWDHGVAAAQAANESEQASIWTQLALAYAVHKSFIFIRVPLTAAVLPSVVRTLRSWGWNVGARTAKAAT